MGKALGGFGGLALIGITVLAEFYWSSNSDGGEPRVGQPFGPGPSHGPPEVTTKYGRLAGTWLSSRDGRAVAAFEGVPYAAAPVGELRFQRPQPVDSWHGVRSASQRGPPCLQHRRGAEVQDLGVEGSEDCLHLNVYAPEKVSGALPVLFWIHGGGWQSGTGSAYGPEFLLDKDVVFVSFNYRLGPLGFLSTGDHVVAGNNGLKDTVFALQWVNDNIAAFGGDPGMVTVLGHGTGAASVHLLTLSTLAKGLFQRAVAMSGSALAPWSFQPPRGPARLRRSLATHTSCPETPSEALVECLRTKDAADIVGVDHGWAQFGPALERGDPVPFLDVHPRDAYSAGYLADGVPFLTGFTEDAGIRQARDVFLDENLVQKISEDFDSFMKLVLCLHDYPEPLVSETLKQIRHFYFGDGPISKMMVNNVSDVLTDGLFSYAATQTAKLHKTHSKAPVFLYEFARRGSREALDAGSGPLAGDELQYLFPSKESAAAERLAQDDELVSRQLIDHLVHFAQTGSSTADDSWQEVVHPNEAEFMYLSTPGKSKMSANFAPQRMRLWDQLPIRIGSVPVMHDEL